jgi:integrase
MPKENHGFVERMPSGRWRLRLYDPVTGKQRSWTRDTKQAAIDLGNEQHNKLEGQALELKKANLTDDMKVEFTELLTQYRKKGAGALQVRFSELLDRFEKEKMTTFSEMGRRSYETALRMLRQYWVDKMGDPLIHSIDSADVATFLSWRRTHPLRRKGDGTLVTKRLSEATVKQTRAILGGIFAWAIRPCKLLTTNPVADVDAPVPERRDPVSVSPEQFAKLLKECGEDDMLRLFARAAAATGARTQELLHLRWEDVDYEGGFLSLKSNKRHHTKTKKTRLVPMGSVLQQEFEAHALKYQHVQYDGVRSPWIFHRVIARGAQYRAGERIAAVRQPLQAAAKRAGVADGFRPHDCRHARATTLLAKGHSLKMVAEMLGHSSTATTEQIYAHLVPEHLKSLVADE